MPEEQINPLWEDNEIQFARLICEIVATQDDLRDDRLCEAMSLEWSDLNELFARANRVWEQTKANL